MNWLEFITFDNALIRNVVLGSTLLALSSSVVGCFTLLRKRALVGDAVSHSVLPGVCLAFLFQGTKDPLVLLIGAFITGWLSLLTIDLITKRSRIPEDAATGLVLSVFFGVGILLLTYIQHLPNLANQSGLDSFLFGNILSISEKDLYVFGAVAICLLTCVWLFYKEFQVLSFDEGYASTIGMPVKGLRLLLTTLTVLAVVVGIQSVGVVLMAALLITPAAAARFLTNRLGPMVIIAAIIGATAGLTGTFISSAFRTPTGPWIVMALSIMALGAFFFAPKQGILAKWIRQRHWNRQIQDENILKAIFQFQLDNNSNDPVQTETLIKWRPMEAKQLRSGLKRLSSQGYLEQNNGWLLTQVGQKRGERITRLHRLWETYLTKYLKIAPDHVHEDAESIEHIITPELELELEKLLDYPEKDPHDSSIPRS